VPHRSCRRPTGAEPGYKVFYTPASAELQRLEYEGGTFPDVQSIAQETLPLTAFERADYIEMISQLQSDNNYHQLMGYPTLIQFTPPELYCEAGVLISPATLRLGNSAPSRRRLPSGRCYCSSTPIRNPTSCGGTAGNSTSTSAGLTWRSNTSVT